MAGRFFHGLALVRLDDDLNGRNVLRGYVGSSAPEPIRGARARAWRAIAKASRALGEPEVEREALQGAIELEPDFDGELHLRMAELLMVAPHGGYRLPELRFAKGISLLPLRTAELLPRWHEIGRLELASIGFDPEAVRTNLLRQGIWNPAPDASPYELYRLAEIHHAAGDAARARSHLARLLEIVPGFLPAIDLAIEVARTEPTRTRLLQLVAQRVEAGGRTPETTAILREVPLDELDPRDLHVLMRADPEYFGRIAVARTLADAGRPRSALALLETIDPEKFGDEARVLAARLQLEAGQPARTWELLEPMARTLVTVPGALELAVRAASWSGSPAEARGLVGLVAGETRLNRQRRLGIADIALRAGLVQPARRLLEAIDAIPQARGGDLCVALAVAAALDGDADAAKRALARGEAFETKGALERAALVVAIRAGRTSDWRALAERAYSRSSLDALGQTALLVLRGRDDEARARIADLRAKSAESGRALDARWSVLARSIPPDATSGPLEVDPRLGAVAAREIDAFVAGFDAGADPRAAAAWVFESAVPEGFAHAAAAMRARIAAATPGSPAALWPTWSLASLDQASGNVAAARAALATVAALAPDFRPAWDLREVLEPELRLDPVAYGRFRGERERALGANAGTPTEIAQDRARALAAAGDHAGAIAIVAAHAVTTPTSGELAAIAGRSQLALGKPREAVARLAHALSAKPPPVDERGAVASLLEAVDAAERLPEPLPRAQAAEVLTRLAELHENDPRLVLALANIDLQFDPRNPVLGVQRALARLDRYRALHRDQGLDANELGSAAAWIDFVARLDPARAIALAKSELDLAPGSIATWLAAARAHEAAGDAERALTELQLAARVADRGEVSREILRLRSGSDLEGADVVAAIARVQALENRPVPDPSLRLLAARAYANLGARLAPQALELARSAGNDPTATAAEKRAAALLASLAILSRVGGDLDLTEPVRLLEGLEPERPSRLDQDFLRALRGVAAAAAAQPAATAQN